MCLTPLYLSHKTVCIKCQSIASALGMCVIGHMQQTLCNPGLTFRAEYQLYTAIDYQGVEKPRVEIALQPLAALKKPNPKKLNLNLSQ